uniref:Interleukin-4 n=2 Tax=Steinernema glaseri TaxID=37863 RepID=A0A1I8A1R2_9BILA
MLPIVFSALLLTSLSSAASRSKSCGCQALISGQKTIAYMVRELYSTLQLIQEMQCANVEDVVEVNKLISSQVQELDRSHPCKKKFRERKAFSSECPNLESLVLELHDLVEKYRKGMKDMCKCRCELSFSVFKSEFSKLHRDSDVEHIMDCDEDGSCVWILRNPSA